MKTSTVSVDNHADQRKKPKTHLIFAPGALEEARLAPLRSSDKGWGVIGWIREFFLGRTLTKEDILRERLDQARAFGFKPEEVENFWEGIEELRPPNSKGTV